MVNVEIYKPKQKEDKKLKKLDKYIPKPPFRWLMIAPSGSGKSNIIKNIIYNWYKPYFDEIYIWCASLDDCLEYQRLSKKNRMSKKVKIINDIDFDELKELYDDIEYSNLIEDTPSRVLFVFDDHITTAGFSSKAKMNVIDRIFIRGRHANISILISSQKYRALNQNMRAVNATAVTILNGIPRMEGEQIAMEHSGALRKNDFYDLMNMYLEKKYSSFTINYHNDLENRYLNKKFEPIDYLEEEEEN